jgi:Na+/proline symporter
MDNCAVNMLSFSGIYTNSIHHRLIEPQATERRLLTVNRITSLIFAIISIGLSFLFTDMPAAMRFLWQTVPLMGIAWFFAILWRRTNRWGAIASFAAALAATGLAKFVLPNFQLFGWSVTWAGDAGLPWTITLYLVAGIGAGILVSLLTPPESKDRTDQFFLLLKTPIGQEHVLRDAGYKELPGNDTYEMPVDVTVQSRVFDVAATAETYDAGGAGSSGGGAVATAVAPAIATTPLSAEEALGRIDNREARRQSMTGFAVLSVVVLVMLVGIKILAKWLAP